MKNTGKKFLSDIKLHSDYLKWKDDRYETWNEACESILDGHRQKYVGINIEEELSSALESMKDMRVFASQRNLQFRGPQIERSNARIYNCSVLHAVTNKAFQNTMFLLMNGCGVGVSLLKPFVDNISSITKRTKGAKTFSIPDSIEGWSDAIGVLMSSYFVDKQPFPEYAGYEVRFDYSQIRPKGAYISGGYKAPGPGELKKSLEKMESFLESLVAKQKLSPRDVYDLICMSSDAVISGGVRRSALIMLVDPNDEEMIMAKTGNWRQDTPWRARSNNSVMLKRGLATKEQFDRLIALNDGDNDIGFVFVDSWFDLVNPCAEIGFSPINASKDIDLCSIDYADLPNFIAQHENDFGVQFCVSGDTKLITKNGIDNIRNLAEKNINCDIWNGEEWSNVKPIKTQSNQKLYRVHINDGSYLDATANHRFLAKFTHQKDFKEYTTLELLTMLKSFKSNIQLPRFTINYQDGQDNSHAYDYGFLLGDGTCKDYSNGKSRLPFASVYGKNVNINFPFVSGVKSEILTSSYGTEYYNVTFSDLDREFSQKLKYENGLPSEIFTWSKQSIINFIAGWIDTDGTITYNNKARIYGSEDKIRDCQLLLTKIGVNSSVNLMEKSGEITNLGQRKRDVWYIQITDCSQLWCSKTKFDLDPTPAKFKAKYQIVKTIEELDGLHDTYCFEEFKLHQGVFNNVLTKQCNLTSMNAEKMTSEEFFLKSCKDAAILGTLQAGYTNFPYLGQATEAITRREALLGVSMTGWMNNPKMFNAELLRKGARIVKETNVALAKKLGINPAARTTCVKPEGNLSVIAQTSSGIHPEHSEMFFRIMQLNKESEVAKYLAQHMPFLLEESVWSAFKTDYVVFVPVQNPKTGYFKKDMKGVKHLEFIKLVQENWVIEGTTPELGISNKTRHNVSSTVIIDDKSAITQYIWDNQHVFSGISFISDFGDKDFNQAPFTSVLTPDEIFEKYGKGALFASGLIVDGLHYFEGNLWQACDCALDKTIPVVGTREQVLLKKSWLDRAKKFAKNYFKGDMKNMVYCLKDVHLSHKWETIARQLKDVDFSKILPKPEYTEVEKFAGVACSSGSCDVTQL